MKKMEMITMMLVFVLVSVVAIAAVFGVIELVNRRYLNRYGVDRAMYRWELSVGRRNKATGAYIPQR